VAKNKSSKDQKTVNLALQGGGAHGAYAWGVLDKLLEDGRIDIEGITATSAGTMNACAMVSGLQEGGREKARENLEAFWWNIHLSGQRFNPLKRMPWHNMFSMGQDAYPAHFFFESMTRLFSPYQYNPFDINPLRDVLSDTVDFEKIRTCQSVKLFISATHVHSGKVRVFDTSQISIDVAMASACLPFLFKAVTIEGEDYWDGGYMGNPALYPLFYKTKSRDVIIVHLNPIEREETPTTADGIMNRINEISFNSSLINEMRAISFVKKLIEQDMLKDEYKDNFKDVLVHSVRADKALKDLSVASKFYSDWTFLTDLRDKGRNAMDRWLKKNFDKLGVEDTVVLNKEFLKSGSRGS
jgi:NTE family protein